MKLRKLAHDHVQDWPMIMTAEDQQKMLREKLERAAIWASTAGACVADILKECCCEYHRQQDQIR